jgi:Cytochrome c554 and c-prime
LYEINLGFAPLIKSKVFQMRLISPVLVFALLLTSSGLALLFFVIPSSAFTVQQPVIPKPIPAFYSGGLEQGSGGQLERDWQAYDSSNLFAPSQARNSANALMPNAAYPSPESCGSCHTEIYAHWQNSLHASSATDPAYLAVKELFAFERGEPAVRLCAGCHAPVALMTGEVGLYSRESASSRQGVSCGFCHTVDASHGGNGAYTSHPSRVRAYLGVPWNSFHGDSQSAEGGGQSAGGSDPSSTAISSGSSVGSSSGTVSSADSSSVASSPFEGLARWLVYQKPAAHITDMRSSALATGEVCQSCHQFTINGVAVQNTWAEWKASSFAAKGVTCQGCHFSSSGQAGVSEPGEIAVGRPRDAMLAHALGGGSVTVAGRGAANLAYLKGSLKLEAERVAGRLEVRVRNTGAGHAIPSGVTDLRELWLEVTAFDARGKTVFSSGVANAAGNLEGDARLFHVTLLDEQGRKLERHDIWRAARIGVDTRIPADGMRRERFNLPDNTARVKVRLLWRDLPANFVAWVLKRNAASVPAHELLVWESK